MDVKAKNCVMHVGNESINLGNATIAIPLTVIRYNLYGRNYALCPKCSAELGGYYNSEIRKFKFCPYCGESICFIDD